LGGGEYRDPHKVLARWQQGRQRNLSEAVRLWPTPRAIDGRSAGPGTKDATLIRLDESAFGLNLAEAVQVSERFPTPCARDWKDNGKSPSELERNSTTLATIAGGSLNPTWVEWLMGFPLGWTVLEHWVTPSSRKSRKSSGG
jgi:hypothetical protein